MANGALVANQVVEIAVVAPGAAAPATTAYTRFGAGDRQGMISFDLSIIDEVEENPGFSQDVENQRLNRGSGTIAIECQDNDVTGPLFWGERRGWALYFRRMVEGIATGFPIETGKAMFETIEHAPSGSALLNWSVALQVDGEPNLSGVQ